MKLRLSTIINKKQPYENMKKNGKYKPKIIGTNTNRLTDSCVLNKSAMRHNNKTFIYVCFFKSAIWCLKMAIVKTNTSTLSNT